MQYTEQELQKLISDVEKEFTSHLAKAEENYNLAKSEDGEKKPEKKPEGEEKAPPAEASKEGEKAPEGEAKPEGESAPAAAAPAAEAPPAEAAPAAPSGMQGAGHTYDNEDMEHMKQMYMSMSEEELKLHHDCIASLAKCGQTQPSAPQGALGPKGPDSNPQPAIQKNEDGFIKPSEPKGALGPKDAASDANGDKINVGLNKAEAKRENGGQIEASAPPKASPGAKSPASKVEGVQMEKSENQEMELLKAENEKLQKTLDTATAILTKLVEKRGAPAGKAITSLDVIAKSEGVKEDKTLSKIEIDSILNKKAADPKLEKSDRDAINAFYLGDRNVNSISHLLK